MSSVPFELSGCAYVPAWGSAFFPMNRQGANLPDLLLGCYVKQESPDLAIRNRNFARCGLWGLGGFSPGAWQKYSSCHGPRQMLKMLVFLRARGLRAFCRPACVFSGTAQHSLWKSPPIARL